MRALVLSAIVCGCLVGEVGALAAQPLMAAPVRVGGNIRPPAKTHHVSPVYPPDALNARVAGIVILEASIGTDGYVTDARVLRGVPMLNDAAIDAVRQWQYEPTLLNGTPVPVIMTVTVNFTPEPARENAAGPPPRREPPGPIDPFAVAPRRVGSIWIGMPVLALTKTIPAAQLRAVPARTPIGANASDMEIALEPGGPAALLAMIVDGQVRLIEVRSDRFRTAEGLGIGSSLGQIRQHHPGVRVVMCARGPCAVTPSRAYAFELSASGAAASDPASVPDTAQVTRVLVAETSTP